MNIDDIKFDGNGLVPVITQDKESGDVLMLAWMNSESLAQTLETGIMTYWSRSRQKLWVKGETSGNLQMVIDGFVDCDADCLLFKVEQKGRKAACHEGYRSCFFRKIKRDDGTFSVIAKKIFDPEDTY